MVIEYKIFYVLLFFYMNADNLSNDELYHILLKWENLDVILTNWFIFDDVIDLFVQNLRFDDKYTHFLSYYSYKWCTYHDIYCQFKKDSYNICRVCKFPICNQENFDYNYHSSCYYTTEY